MTFCSHCRRRGRRCSACRVAADWTDGPAGESVSPLLCVNLLPPAVFNYDHRYFANAPPRTAAALCSFRGFMCQIFVNLAATVNAGDQGDAAVYGS